MQIRVTFILCCAMLIGCDSPAEDSPPIGSAAKQDDAPKKPWSPEDWTFVPPGEKCFGIPNDRSGGLTAAQEPLVPPELRGGYMIFAVQQLTQEELEEKLTRGTRLAEETHDGRQFVAVRISAAGAEADAIGAHLMVIERYEIIP